MEDYRKEEKQHKVILTNREKLLVNGVEDVESFDEDKIILYTVEGIMTVKGAEFRISLLNVEDGELEAEGEIDTIEYTAGHKKEKIGLFGKIFK